MKTKDFLEFMECNWRAGFCAAFLPRTQKDGETHREDARRKFLVGN